AVLAVEVARAVEVVAVAVDGAEAADEIHSKPQSFSMKSEKNFLTFVLAHLSQVILLLPLAATAVQTGKTFPSPETAVSALKQATSTENAQALREIFGPAATDIQNPDRVQATNEFDAFTTALNETNHLVHESATKYVLEVGTNSWPFPVPLVKKDGGW